MVDSDFGEPTPSVPAPESGVRPSWWASGLVALATLVAVISVFSTWVKVQALDTDTWVDLSDQLLAEPEVQDALSIYVVDQIYQQLDVSAEISASLPDDFRGLGDTLAAALRGPATDGVRRLIASDEFRDTWLRVNRVAHQALVNILSDDVGPSVSTADGAVTLDLGELVRVVGRQLGLSGSALDRLPEDAGRVTIFETDQLDSAQTAVQVLDTMSWFLVLVVVALYAAGVYLADGRRLRMLRNVGLGLIGAGVFVLIVRAIVHRATLDAIVANPANRPLADQVAYVATGLMRRMAWSGIVYGVLLAGFATLLGTRPWARATRRFVAPLLNGSAGSFAAVTALVVALVLWWSPGRAFDGWVTGLTLIGLVIGAAVALRRSTQAEFPDVTAEDVIGSMWRRASAVSGDSSGASG